METTLNSNQRCLIIIDTFRGTLIYNQHPYVPPFQLDYEKEIATLEVRIDHSVLLRRDFRLPDFIPDQFASMVS